MRTTDGLPILEQLKTAEDLIELKYWFTSFLEFRVLVILRIMQILMCQDPTEITKIYIAHNGSRNHHTTCNYGSELPNQKKYSPFT